MQFWLTDISKTTNVLVQLPVNPDSFVIGSGVTINSININSIGEVGIFGKGNLTTFSISSFFPKQRYPFVKTKTLKAPYEYVKQVDSMMQSGKPIRFIVTGTPVNIPVFIEAFEYGERDGSGDVYFTISFKEYKFLTTILHSSSSAKKPVSRPVQKPPVIKTYIVKAGDTASIVAKKVYGDSKRYVDIVKKNKLKAPYKLKIGQKLVI